MTTTAERRITLDQLALALRYAHDRFHGLRLNDPPRARDRERVIPYGVIVPIPVPRLERSPDAPPPTQEQMRESTRVLDEVAEWAPIRFAIRAQEMAEDLTAGLVASGLLNAASGLGVVTVFWPELAPIPATAYECGVNPAPYAELTPRRLPAPYHYLAAPPYNLPALRPAVLYGWSDKASRFHVVTVEPEGDRRRASAEAIEVVHRDGQAVYLVREGAPPVEGDTHRWDHFREGAPVPKEKPQRPRSPGGLP